MPHTTQVKRGDIFVTVIVGEDKASSTGGQGIAAAVRETLASGLVDASDSTSDSCSGSGGGGGGGGSGGEGEGGDGGKRLLDFADALVLARAEGG